MKRDVRSETEDYSATLLEFEERFTTESACRHYLEQLRLQRKDKNKY